MKIQQQPRTLILSEAQDYHGLAVRWALNQLGAACDWWDRSMFPTADTVSVGIGSSDVSLNCEHSTVSLKANRYSSIWNRRGGPKVGGELHLSDQKVAKSESRRLVDGIVSMLEMANPGALIVNPRTRKVAAEYKIMQLYQARIAGFRVPETLVSNEPHAIRAFRKAHRNRIIGKLHYPYVWIGADGSQSYTYTTLISDEMLSDPAALAACPVIYQEALSISEEIRLIAFGETCFAYEVSRTGKERCQFDSRSEKSIGSVVEVEKSVTSRCLHYMKLMGLSYAAFDLARVDGDLVFLEANESGQFLYIEHRSPEVPLLDAFSRFLQSGSSSFRYRLGADRIKLSEFDETDVSRELFKLNTLQRLGQAITPNALSD